MKMNKRYDKDSHDVNDTVGKLALVKHFRELGYEVIQEPFGIYGIDLQLNMNGKTRFIDAEICSHWKSGDKVPFPKLNILARKKKYGDKPYSYIAMIRHDLKRAAVVKIDDLLPEYEKNISNRFVDNELVFAMPLEFVNYIDLTRKDTLLGDLDPIPTNQLCNSGLTLEQMNKL